MIIDANIVIEMHVAASKIGRKEKSNLLCGDRKLSSDDVGIVPVAVHDEFSLLCFKLKKLKMNIDSMIKSNNLIA
jgi:hypothetical protein